MDGVVVGLGRVDGHCEMGRDGMGLSIVLLLCVCDTDTPGWCNKAFDFSLSGSFILR
jgi:hypothetical protein